MRSNMQWLHRGHSNHGNYVHKLKSLIDYWLRKNRFGSTSSWIHGVVSFLFRVFCFVLFCSLDACKSKGFCGECQRTPGPFSVNCFLVSRFINEQFLASACCEEESCSFWCHKVRERPLQARSGYEGRPRLLSDTRNKAEKEPDVAAGVAVRRTTLLGMSKGPDSWGLPLRLALTFSVLSLPWFFLNPTGMLNFSVTQWVRDNPPPR